MAAPRPLDVPELLEHCIHCLDGSTSTLISCSLVARSWVNPAQSVLFRDPSATNDLFLVSNNVLHKFYRTLGLSPHLVRHIRTFTLHPGFLSAASLETVASIEFTHLTRLILHISNPASTESNLPLQSLLRVPNLRYLTLLIDGSFATFAHILEGQCSRSIQHLSLSCWSQTTARRLPALLRDMPAVHLKSLGITMWGPEGPELLPWLPYPFDVSNVKALRTELSFPLPCETIRPPVVEILDIFILRNEAPAIQLSTFPNLKFLRFHMVSGMRQTVVGTLATLTRNHSIHTIVISVPFELPVEQCSELDSVLASISCPSLLCVEIEPRNMKRDLSSSFPQLIARGLLRAAHRSNEMVEARWRDLVNTL
ncbi:hypothetical protein R3P38DRAFT_3120572 [Favolaschia claudopus]|uniref:F-box domain-containing protein n=1 Tax=Favolaschia claudopus TaxID=2862362 RepID=A0AAV9ZD80_9AGAR